MQEEAVDWLVRAMIVWDALGVRALVTALIHMYAIVSRDGRTHPILWLIVTEALSLVHFLYHTRTLFRTQKAFFVLPNDASSLLDFRLATLYVASWHAPVVWSILYSASASTSGSVFAADLALIAFVGIELLFSLYWIDRVLQTARFKIGTGASRFRAWQIYASQIPCTRLFRCVDDKKLFMQRDIDNDMALLL